MQRSVFIGGKQIGVNCLRQLLRHKIRPGLVIANLDDDGISTWHESLAEVAQENNLTLIKKTPVTNPLVIKKMSNLKPEIIFCIGSTQLIPKSVLQIPTLGCVNLHPALLPKYRGRYSTVHAIFNGEKETGVTLHWVDEGIDSGPIISQKKIAISESDTAKTLYNKFTQHGEKLFVAFLKELRTGKKIHATPQNEKEATYYPKQLPNRGEIDWNWSGKKIRNFIRAMTFEPFPPAAFMLGKKRMVIVDEKYVEGF